MVRSLYFQLGTWTVGGVERVTVVLANAFVKRGWRVAVSAYRFEDRMLLKELSPEIEVVEMAGGLTDENAARLHDVLVRREVSAVINQWCVNYKHTKFLRRAMAGTAAKLIAVHHNRPDMNNRIMNARSPLLKWLWRRITAMSLRKVYAESDRYVVLSPSFIELFKNFTGVKNGDKLVVIPNPVTVGPERLIAVENVEKRGDFNTEAQRHGGAQKENVLLYVGRLEETQKRVSRVIEVWRQLCNEFSDWRLEIVGDGPDRARYENLAADLPRIHFVGTQPPADYYARAKILLLTSDFEGFGLVIVEAMTFGCVPVVYASYEAASEIVDDGLNGILTPMPYACSDMVRAVRSLTENEDLRNIMACAALEKARLFSLPAIVDTWQDFLSSIEAMGM